MPNLVIREKKVVRFIPRRAAAPAGPPTRPLHAVSARTIASRCLRSYSSRRSILSLGEFVFFQRRAQVYDPRRVVSRSYSFFGVLREAPPATCCALRSPPAR